MEVLGRMDTSNGLLSESGKMLLFHLEHCQYCVLSSIFQCTTAFPRNMECRVEKEHKLFDWRRDTCC